MRPLTDTAEIAVLDAIREGRVRLERAGVPAADAGLDAEVLARHVLAWDRAALLTHGRAPAPAGFAARYDAAIARRAAREPVALITGTREFWGLDFEVTRDVLVPRPETEWLVTAALDAVRSAGPAPRVADIGTGSGCIAIAIAAALPATQIVATDISAAALAVAARNAARLGVSGRVRFVRTDLFEGLTGPFDLIASNPPYIPVGDAPALQSEVVDFEPASALFGGADGLDAIRRLSANARAHLAPGGTLLLEIGFNQRAAVDAIARADGWTPRTFIDDLAGIPRVAVLAAPSSREVE